MARKNSKTKERRANKRKEKRAAKRKSEGSPQNTTTAKRQRVVQLRKNPGKNGRARFGAPVALSAVRKGVYWRSAGSKNHEVVVGRDYIGQVKTSSAGQTSGDILASFSLKPISFTNSRVRLMTQLFEKFRFKKFEMHYEPSTATSTSGSLVAAVLRDPNDEVTVGTVNTQEIISCSGFGESQVWAPHVARMVSENVPYLFCQKGNSDNRLASQGVYKIAAYTDLAANLVLGSLYIDYVIEFQDQLNEIGQGTEMAYGVIKTTGTVGVADSLWNWYTFATNADFLPTVLTNTSNTTLWNISADGFAIGDVIQVMYTISQPSGTAPGVNVVANGCTLIDGWNSSNTTTANFQIFQYKISAPSPTMTIQFNATATIPAGTKSYLQVSRLFNNGANFPAGNPFQIKLDRNEDEIDELRKKFEQLTKFVKTFAGVDSSKAPRHDSPRPKAYIPRSGASTPGNDFFSDDDEPGNNNNHL